MKKFLLALILLVVPSCLTLRLENRLSNTIRSWYDQHYILMDYECPWWIDSTIPREKMLFLKATPAAQEKYTKIFWDTRMPSLKEEYIGRIAWVEMMCREPGKRPWDTDRGRIVLLCGVPLDEEYINDTRQASTLRRDEETIEGYSYLAWGYFFGGAYVTAWFRYKEGHWRFEPPSAIASSEMTRFMQWCQWFWSPFEEEGWGKVFEVLR